MAPRKKATEQPQVMTLEQKAAKYYELDKQEKDAKKAKTPIGDEFKSLYPTKGQYEAGEFMIVRGTQERTNMNEERLIQKLKDLGFNEAIATKEVPNQEVIESLIYEGKLPAEVLQSCVDVQYVQTVQVKKV